MIMADFCWSESVLRSTQGSRAILFARKAKISGIIENGFHSLFDCILARQLNAYDQFPSIYDIVSIDKDSPKSTSCLTSILRHVARL